MSATRITKFECDFCGMVELSPDNYSLPENWEYKRRPNKKNLHRCESCKQKKANDSRIKNIE